VAYYDLQASALTDVNEVRKIAFTGSKDSTDVICLVGED